MVGELCSFAIVDIFCRVLCCQQVVLPVEGPVPSQRPHPDKELSKSMRWSVWVFSIMFLTSFIFAFPSLFRGRILGVAIDALGCVCAIIGLYGTLNLSWKVVAVSLIFQTFLGIGFLAFIILNYYGSLRAEDKYAWVVLALYLPDVFFNFVTLFAVVPLAVSYYKMAKKDSQESTTRAV